MYFDRIPSIGCGWSLLPIGAPWWSWAFLQSSPQAGQDFKRWNKGTYTDTDILTILYNSWHIMTLIWRSIQNLNFVEKMFEVYFLFPMEGMVMQLLAGSKLLEVDQSVKDLSFAERESRRNTWCSAFDHFCQEDRMLFQGAQKLFGMASGFKNWENSTLLPFELKNLKAVPWTFFKDISLTKMESSKHLVIVSRSRVFLCFCPLVPWIHLSGLPFEVITLGEAMAYVLSGMYGPVKERRHEAVVSWCRGVVSVAAEDLGVGNAILIILQLFCAGVIVAWQWWHDVSCLDMFGYVWIIFQISSCAVQRSWSWMNCFRKAMAWDQVGLLSFACSLCSWSSLLVMLDTARFPAASRHFTLHCDQHLPLWQQNWKRMTENSSESWKLQNFVLTIWELRSKKM